MSDEIDFRVHSIVFEESGMVVRYTESEGVAGSFFLTKEVTVPYQVGETEDDQLKYWFTETLQSIEELIQHVEMYIRKANSGLRGMRK